MDRYPLVLALVLQEETSYRQPPGGPFVRLIVGKGTNERRRKRNLPPLPLGRYTFDHERGVLRNESGVEIDVPTVPDGCAYDDDPHDTGGRTCMGILQREYDSWRRSRGLATQDVWRIADAEVVAIFRAQYWDALRCGEMPAGIDYAMADFGFLCGVPNASQRLQRLLGVKVDGQIGLATLAAVRAADIADLAKQIAAVRERYLRGCRTFWKHGDGWLARAGRVHERVVAMVQATGNGQQAPVVRLTAEPVPETPSPSPAASRDSGADTSLAGKSTIANGAAQITTIATTIGVVATTAAQTRSSGLGEFLLALLTNPTFMASVIVSVCLLVIFREDIKRRISG